MANRRTPRLLLASALGVAAIVAVPGAASGRAAACTSTACSTEMTVGAMTVHYTTPESFFPSEQRLNVRLTVGGEKLVPTKRIGNCETRYAAPGIRATVRACAEGSPLQLFAHRVWGGTVSLKMTYRAVAQNIPQQVKGVHAGSGQAQGAATGTGGVGPR